MSGSVLEASWALLGAFGDALGALGRVSELFWRLLGALGRPSWELRGPSWEALGTTLRALWSSLDHIGASPELRKLLGSRLDGLGSHLDSQKGPKRYPKWTPEAAKITFGTHPTLNRSLRAMLCRFSMIS